MGKGYVALQALDVGTPEGGSNVKHYEPGEPVGGAEHFANLQGLVDGRYLAEAGSPAARALDAAKADAAKAEAAAASSGPSKAELYERASELDIAGRSDMSKEQLAAAILEAEPSGS